MVAEKMKNLAELVPSYRRIKNMIFVKKIECVQYVNTTCTD